MPNILINGFSAKAGGGRAILEDYLAVLVNEKSDRRDYFFIITPNHELYRHRAYKNIYILKIPLIFNKFCFLPFFYAYFVPKLIKDNEIDVVLNFGDIILPIHTSQVYFFDWSYAVYPKSIVWKRMDLTSYIQRRLKYYIIRLTLRFPKVVIAQTATMVKRLKNLYGLRCVELVASPLTLANMAKAADKDFYLPLNRTRLLCLANWAPHKNLEIFLPLARLFKEKRSNFTIVTTLDLDHNAKAKRFLGKIVAEKLTDYVVNIGHVDSIHVPALFEQCDGLLLPTLLETYGLPFIEAMFNKKTVLTSDFDFTRDVCGDAAYYFDPLDAKSIYHAICIAFRDESERRKKIEIGFKIASRVNDWPTAFRKYQDCLLKAATL